MRLLCEAVNTAIREQRANLDSVLSGTFTKETENGTDLYTPREVRFRIPCTDERGQATYRTVQVPLATLATPQALHVDKVTFSMDCGLSVKSGELMMGKAHKCDLFHKSVNTHIEFTLTGGGNARELETLITGYEASLREAVEK